MTLRGKPARSIDPAPKHVTVGTQTITIAEVPRGLVVPGMRPERRVAVSGTPEQIRHQRATWIKPARRISDGRYRFNDMEFWAEGGGVYVIDHNPPPDKAADARLRGEDPYAPIPITLPNWKARCKAFQAMLAHYDREHTHSGNVQLEAQYRDNLKTLVEAVWVVYRIAERQGDLTDPGVARHYREHLAKSPQVFPVNWDSSTITVGSDTVIAPD